MFKNSLTRLTEQLRRIARGDRSAVAHRELSFELLEPRLTLAATGLVPVGSQPAGSLAGKIVYLSPGHGLQYDSSNQWYLGRSETQEMVESFGTQDQATYLADYLFRAGATVVPMRPIGRQLNEIVLDNDSAGVTFAGSWSNSSGTRFYDEDYGATDDAVHYRFANISGTETATATYTPNIASAGFYPVYAWAAHGSNRTSQLYEINHSGGQTQVRIDHRKVGNGWVYLGTYHFDAGSDAANGSVVISNQSTAGGSVVIADAIRFGNGMGDVPDGTNGAGNSGGTISGRPREDEASLLWIIRSIGQGVNTSTFFGVTGTDPNVSGPARLAQEMNNNSNPFGSSLYLAIHSNAFNGTARGAIGLITNQGSPTPNQTALATWLGQYVNEDLRAVDQDLGFTWSDRTTYTLTGSYGEFNADDFTNSNSVVEMDASLAEVAFHDNADDALIMRDPKGRDAIARALYRATVQYFDVYGGLVSPIMQPSRPINISAVSNTNGAVTLSWATGPSSTAYGAPATDYRIYASTDGYGFDGGRLASSIAGGTATSKTITGLDPTLPYYFKIVAVNAGGESPGSEVATALPSGGVKQVLIVNGFDRNHVSQDYRYTTTETIPGSNITVDRVYARYNNSFDYVVQVASAIQASKPGVHFASASNELVVSGAVNLNNYDAAIWISGTESTIDRTFNATEQTLITSFINTGGSIFFSGSDIGFDLDQQNNGRTFYESTLKANYVSDDAGTYTATANATGIFAGMSSFVFSNGSAFSNLDGQVYGVAAPDVISTLAGAVSALTYSGGTGGTAAIQVQGTSGAGNIVMFAFPFEALTNASRRQTVMSRILDFFGVAPPAPQVDVKSRVNGQDADLPTGPIVAAGASVALTYIVTNPGNVPLSSVAVTDDNGTPGNATDDFSATYTSGDTNANNLLDVGEIWTYSATRTAIIGQYSGKGQVTAVGNAQNVDDSDLGYYFGSAPKIISHVFVAGQEANSPPGPTVVAGSAVSFFYLLTNAGNIALTNVSVVDDNGTPEDTSDDFSPLRTIGDNNGNNVLDIGENWLYTATRPAGAGQQTTAFKVTANDAGLQIVTSSVESNYFGLLSENADFNGDTIVDGADYVLWRKNAGLTSGATRAQGDANGDELVNQTDYAIWRSQFGTVPLAPAGAAAGAAISTLSLSHTVNDEPVVAPTSEVPQHRVTPAARNLAFDALVRTDATTARRRLTFANLVNAQQNHDWAALLNAIAEHQSVRSTIAGHHESSHDAHDSPSENGDSLDCELGAGRLRRAF